MDHLLLCCVIGTMPSFNAFIPSIFSMSLILPHAVQYALMGWCELFKRKTHNEAGNAVPFLKSH